MLRLRPALRFIQRCNMESRRTALVGASLLWALTAQTAAKEQAVLGQGNVSCGSWLENRRGDDAQVSARTAWILGYITAFNQYGSKQQGDVSGGKGTEEMTAWIDDYFRHHPVDNLYWAAPALIDEFKQQTARQFARPPTAPPPADRHPPKPPSIRLLLTTR